MSEDSPCFPQPERFKAICLDCYWNGYETQCNFASNLKVWKQSVLLLLCMRRMSRAALPARLSSRTPRTGARTSSIATTCATKEKAGRPG